jgi:hypothetical protein
MGKSIPWCLCLVVGLLASAAAVGTPAHAATRAAEQPLP